MVVKKKTTLTQTAQRLCNFYIRLKTEQLDREEDYLKRQITQKIKYIERTVKDLPEGTHYLTDIYNTRYQFKVLIERLDEKPTLFVMGEGNVGKSTVLNALLGRPIAKMKFEPMTWKIDVYRKNDDKGIYAITQEHEVIHYPNKQTAILQLEEEEAKRLKSIDTIHKLIQEKTELVWQKAKDIPYELVKEKLDAYKEKVWKEHLYQSDIVEVHWSISKTRLLEDFRVVDTPGLEQNRFSPYLENVMQNYFNDADVILWVLDINKLSSETTQIYQQDIQKKRAIALLNRCDLLHTSEDTILTEAQSLYGWAFKSIVPFSATLALQGQIKQDEELLEKSHYYQLMNEINNHFLADIKRLKNQNILESAQREQVVLKSIMQYALEKLNGKIKAYNAEVETIRQVYQQLIVDSLETLGDIILLEKQQLKDNVSAFIEDLLTRENFILYDEVQTFLIDYISQNDIKLYLKRLIEKMAKLREEYISKQFALKENVLSDLLEDFNLKSYFNHIADSLEDNNRITKWMKKMMLKRSLLDAGEKIIQRIETALDKMEVDLKEQVKVGILQEAMAIIEQKQQRFDMLYGDDAKRIDQIYAFKSIEVMTEQPIKEARLIDLIKGGSNDRKN